MLPSGEGNSVPVKRPRELSPEISFQTNPRPRASIGETWGLVREVGFVNRSGRKPFFEKKPVRQKSKKNSATPPTSPDLKNFYRGSSQPHRTKPAAKRAPSGGEKEKNARQPKWGKARAARSADTTAPRSTVRGKPAYPTVAFPTLAPALVRRRPRRTSRRAKRTSPQPSRRCRGTTVLNSLREAAHVKKPPRTKNNCSSTCWSGGDGLGSPAMITNEARAARTSSPARRRRRFAGRQARPLVEEFTDAPGAMTTRRRRGVRRVDRVEGSSFASKCLASMVCGSGRSRLRTSVPVLV